MIGLPNESDALSSIAGALLPQEGWVVVIYHAYFDESGTHAGSPFMSMAGYVMTSDQARKFSRDWPKQLRKIGISCAHMTDCANGRGEYTALSLEQRVRSEELLIGLIKRRTIFGICATISQSSYEEKTAGLPKNVPSAYTFLLLTLATKIRDVAEQRQFRGKIAYFFEAGHAKAEEANRYMGAIPIMGRKSIEHHYYAGHAFVDKRTAPPLQAADMLAWQLRHYRIRSLAGHDRPRADLVALGRPVDLQVHIEDPHIDALVRILRGADVPFNKLHPDLRALIREMYG
jgi:hypothetical protein